MKKNGLARVLRPLGSMAIAVTLASAASGAAAQDKVQFLLDLIPSGEYAAYYAGVANGFFKEQNIDLTIGRGYGSGDTVAKVAAGAAPFGIADIGPALAARAKANAPIKVISSMYVFSPHSMFVLESSGIKSLKDLEGKRVGITPGNSHKLYFPEVARRLGIDESKVEWVNVDATSMASLLISKRLDAVPFFAIHHYYMNKAAQAQGEKIIVLPYVATGFTIYSSALLTNENTAKSNPDLVKRFLAAAWKSVRWARDNVEQACALHVKANPEVKQDDCVGSLTAVNGYVFNDFSAKVGLGRFDPQRSDATWNQVVKAQELNPAFNYKQVIDTSFLPANNR
jgi:NitT/TauT family transport system substrate-binding protein